MTSCPVCDDGTILQIERRDSVPIAQNLLFQSREDAIRCPSGTLNLVRCESCGFVWNADFDSKLLAYGIKYENDQNFSARFRDHTSEIADIIAAMAPTREPVRLVEVGCGQGTFLHILAKKLGDRLESATGFDPAWRGDAASLPSRCHVRPEYFQAASLTSEDGRPNLVVSRHVIEHVPDTSAFLSAMRASVPEGTPVVIETPDVDWILRNGVFFDFYYEHCSLFTRHSLALALERAGFVVHEVRRVFDGQYMVAIASAGVSSVDRDASAAFGDLGYREKRDLYLGSLAELIGDKSRLGRVALWGGASKGVTICLTLPGASNQIDCVIDINERKQGCFLPTSGIPVVSPDEAWARGVRSAVVVNPAYVEEIRSLCSERNLGFDLVSIEEIEFAV